MSKVLASIVLSAACVLCPLTAQQRSYTAADVENGSQLYRTHCFTCHGERGDLVPGVDLRRGQFRHAASDDDLSRLIASGIPGTAMPPTNLPEASRTALVAYLRGAHADAVGSGDAEHGRAVFEGKGGCVACHRVNGKGPRVAPDLSDVGALRGAAALERSILDPNETILPQHRYVRAVTRQGTIITGRRLNEDTYTLQLIDEKEHLVSLAKSDLREYTLLKTSPMPSYKGKLSSVEIADVVTYLLSLKGSNTP